MDRKPPENEIIERFAPNTAAFETPRVDGDAIGLLRLVCIISPDTESPAPAIIAASMRGMRILRTMRTFAAVPFPKSAERQSAALIFDEPAKKHAKDMSASAAAISAMIIFFFLSLFIYKLFPAIFCSKLTKTM